MVRIELAASHPSWPHRYERIAGRIRDALGVRGLELHHAGSTSVPGLAAKPVIDVILVVRDPADESGYVPALAAVGFTLVLREPDWFEHRLLRRHDTSRDGAVNLHVFGEGCSEVQRMLAFRDHLRCHAVDRRYYEDTKRSLAAQEWSTVQDYADAKSSVVNEILVRAGWSSD